MRKNLPILLCTFLLSLLTACGDPMLNMATAGGTLVSYSVIGKGPLDYGLSRYTKQDCDVRNPKKYNGAYCVDLAQVNALRPEDMVYCYSTLGTPYCSRIKDPYGNGDQPLGSTTVTAKSYSARRNIVVAETAPVAPIDKASDVNKLKQPQSILPPTAQDAAQRGS